METKFTKGEWKDIIVSSADGWFHRVIAIEGESVCNITTRNTQRAQANAKLIAAAPDLLEALSLLYESLPDGYTSDCLPLVRKAIQKATALSS